MRQKYFEEVKSKFENLTTDELLSIWKENDQDEYTQREIEVTGQILQLRNIEIPVQDNYEEKEDGVYSEDVVISLLKGAQIFLLIFGVVNLMYWYFAGAEGREVILRNFREVKPLLWVEMYGNAIVSGMLIFMSLLCFLQRQNIGILIYSGMLLTFSGIWVLFSGFISIPAYAEYGKTLTVYQVLDGGKYFLFVLGILQLRWGYNQVKDYFKVRKFESVNNSVKDYSNTPT